MSQAPSDSPLLRLEGLSKRFGGRRGRELVAVDSVDLAVAAGETLGLVGESGCGKSTLARMIVRLLKPSAGSVLLKGRSVWDKGFPFKSELPRTLQMVFQDPFSSLNPRLTIGASVREPLDAQGLGTRVQRRERVRELLDQVGVAPDHASRYPHQFSGGQRQRVAIARALAPGPELLVCDEPVSALDVSIQAQILNLFLDLQERLGLAYVFISHDLAVVGHMSDRIAVMYQGRLVELAPAAQLLDKPLHPYTQRLLASAPVPDPGMNPNTDQAAQGSLGALPEPSMPGNGGAPARGCPYLPLCPAAQADCAESRPEWREILPGRFVACRHAGT